MAWNDSGNGKNPWDRGSGQDGPPDLDKIARDLQKKTDGDAGWHETPIRRRARPVVMRAAHR